MLTVRNLQMSYGPSEVLADISLDVGRGEVVTVTGANGSGKTTLIRCIAGELKPAAGSISRTEDFVMLSQHIEADEVTAREFLLTAKPELADSYRKMVESHDKSRDYTRALSAFTDLGGYEFLAELERSAAEFGLNADELNKNLTNFSNGERQILAVVRTFKSLAKLVLADEPLNHLDIRTRVFLEAEILREKRKGRGFLIVTHDRVFADRVADRTLYLQRGREVTVNGGYSQMLEHLELEFTSRKRKAQDISRKIRKLEKEVTAKQSWASRKEASARKQRKLYDGAYLASRAARMAKRGKAAERRQERLIKELGQTKPYVEKRIKLLFSQYEVVERRVVTASGISKSFSEKPVFSCVDLAVHSRERIVLIGPNGSGKTTLMRCLLGELEVDEGWVKLSEHVKYRYLPQDVQTGFERDILLDNLTGYGIAESVVRQYLGAAKLRKERVLQPVSVLSRGELMRAWIVGAILAKAEFLFLDEPTNHLDIESLAVLDQLLKRFPGGMLAISHDRQLIANHAEKVLSLENNSLKTCNL